MLYRMQPNSPIMQRLKRIYSRLIFLRSKLYNTVFGDKKYKKFVIISRSRTGSTLLMAFLRSHPNVHMEGELFKELKGRSCQQIWNSLYSKRPKKIQQVGFKLFYYHPFDDDKQVWEFLNNDDDISVIHLRRKHLLKAYVSQKIGEKTRKWTENINNQEVIKDKKVSLDPKACVEVFETISNYEEDTRNRFGSRANYMEITYEDLVKDQQGEMDIIFEKMGLPAHVVSAKLKKQNPEPLKSLVTNYEELFGYLEHTRWINLMNDQ